MNEFENYFYHKVPHVFENSPAYFRVQRCSLRKGKMLKMMC